MNILMLFRNYSLFSPSIIYSFTKPDPIHPFNLNRLGRVQKSFSFNKVCLLLEV